jgi:methionyl aminopeptidase
MKRNRINWRVPKGVEPTELDKKVLAFQAKGCLVPPRELIKTPEQIEGIRKSGIINTGVLDLVAKEIRAGMSTLEIDKLVYEFTRDHGAIPACLGYEGFPKSCCTSVNEVVCHGIPSEYEILEEGDIINVDCTTILNGYYADASRMFLIGDCSEEATRLVRVTKESIDLVVKN